MTQQQVVRTYSGRTRESALDAYRNDAARALAGGYAPVSHRWTQAESGYTLIVAYQALTVDESAAAAQPEPMQGEAATGTETADYTDQAADYGQPGADYDEQSGEYGQPAADQYTEQPTAEQYADPAPDYAQPAAEYGQPATEYADAGYYQQPNGNGYDMAGADLVEPVAEEGAEPEAVVAEPEQAVAGPEPDVAEAEAAVESEISRSEEVAAVAPAQGAAATPTRDRAARLTIQVLDLHTAGEPLRMIRAGFPDVPDLPVLERRRWVAENADEIRRAIVFEPRGHSDMYGAILLPPHRADADICLLFMHNEGYSTMCGHGVIAVTTALIEEGLFPAAAPHTSIRFEVPAGLVVATAATRRQEDGSIAVDSVKFDNVPSYLAARSLAVAPDGIELFGPAADYGHLNVDVAFGGAYYGIVDAASLGLRVVPEQASALRRAGAAITDVLRRDHSPTHPTDPDLGFVYGTIIVDRDPSSSPDGRARDSHYRNVTIFADAELDRSPCGSGTSALLAQLFYRGAIQIGQEFVNAGITGEAFVGRVEAQTRLADQPAVLTSVRGRAFVTGYSTLVVDQRDPIGEGFLLR